MADISSLLSRVRSASGPDRELDADLWWELEHTDALRAYHAGSTGKPTMVKVLGPGLGRASVRAFAPRFTQSIDAAVALVERVLPGCDWKISTLRHRKGFGADLYPSAADAVARADAATAPLAILAALLTALEQKEGADDQGA